MRPLKWTKQPAEDTMNGLGNTNSGTNNPNSHKMTTTPTKITTTELTENQELSTNPMRYVGKQITQLTNSILEPMQQTECLLGTENQQYITKYNNATPKTI